ncbi:VIT family protein [Prauserella oleivorans]|uniref:VIT family protein n=1 Tax=Prauserella oleivorans TaxID=1478153 RepID=A0ABW5W3H3_9PSEU
MSRADSDRLPHAGENHRHENVSGKLNWLRAAVLGANDGIVSVAGLVVGVAGATTDRGAILIAGVASVVAGGLSMAGGEYVSVSTQRDTERAMIRLEKYELRTMPEEEERELAGIYEEKGLSPELATRVAKELTAKDALGAHADVELHVDPENLTNPWQAAFASMGAFFLGALLPLFAIILPPPSIRVATCAAGVLAGLALTGWASATLGNAPRGRAVVRNVSVGALTMLVTYGVGTLFGVTTG